MTEMKYQPALMQKLAAAVLGFMAYFTRRGKEFMDQPGEEKSRSRADEELEAVDRELEIRGYSMDIVDDLQHRLSLFINRQLEHMGAKASAAIT